MPPEKWLGLKNILDPDEKILLDYGFYHLTNKRVIRSRLFRSKFEKMPLENLQVSEDRRIVNIFFYSVILALIVLIIAPISYFFAGVPFAVLAVDLALGVGLLSSQSALWRFSRKGAYVLMSGSEKWFLMTNGGLLGKAFVAKVEETVSDYSRRNPN